jgi:hypothetical protein
MEHNPTTHAPEARRTSVLGWLFKVALIYVALVFGGGTLANSGYPAAAEVGHFMHTVTLVDPTIRWADSNGFKVVSTGLKGLSEGVPLRKGT